MQNFIVSSHDSLPQSSVLIGQKAAGLNQLVQAGFPVPAGICISTEAFKTAISPFAHRIQTLRRNNDLHIPAVARTVAHEIALLLAELQLPPKLSQELAHIIPLLGGGLVAVRSSATLEDLAEVSFAGQYATVLGVQNGDELEQAILRCWCSFFSANALTAQATYA